MLAPALLSDLSHIAVLIPAWQPDHCLTSLVDFLKPHSFGAIVVVDDGSDPARRPVFDQLRSRRVKVLRHAVNLGKGRALKTGVNHILTEHPGFAGVVTADADGQHTVNDIVRVANALATAEGRAVLGSREFRTDVPLRSRLGNVLTRRLFSLLTGTRLADTQTGLRALPAAILPDLMHLEGERYEYEMSVLAHLCLTGPRPIEVPIETIYLDQNRSSHFDPLLDSVRIYSTLLRSSFHKAE